MVCGAIKYKDKIYSEDEFRAYVNSNPEEFDSILNPRVTPEDIDKLAAYPEQSFDSSIDYNLKSVNILSSEEADLKFKRGDKAGWTLEKILTELQVPKYQRELILSFGTRNREEILTNILANYSYTVEVNVATDKDFYDFYSNQRDRDLGDERPEGESPYVVMNTRTGQTIEGFNTIEEAKARTKELNETNTNYSATYSNMKVDGGTNYRENEIATPAIIPSIKGHAAFSTDKGIGWFRSDEENLISKIIGERGDYIVIDENGEDNDNTFETLQEAQEYANKNGGSAVVAVSGSDIRIPSKTRRILEIQSDLFQKNRGGNIFVEGNNDLISEEERANLEEEAYNKAIQAGFDEETASNRAAFESHEITGAQLAAKRLEATSKNKFMQLLEKDNNWVNFFVKSIIQDSAKKGYEKVLFPVGNTAAKVQGHIVIEDFIKQKEAQLEKINKKIEDFSKIDLRKESDYRGTFWRAYVNNEAISGTYLEKDAAQRGIKDLLKSRELEKNQLLTELENAKNGTLQISKIADFYENTIKNILDKRGYKPERITDEYNNSWYEVNISPDLAQQITLDSSLSDLAEGMKQASVNEERFSAQIERLVQEAETVQKKVNLINEESLRTRMKDALRYIQDPQKKSDLKNFVYFILESSEVLKHYAEQLKKIPQLSIEDGIKELSKAETISKTFTDLITFLKKDFRYVDETNDFKKLVNELASNYDQIQNVYASEAEDLAAEVMKKELEPDAKIAFETLQKELDNLNEQVRRAEAAGAKESYVNGLKAKGDTIRKRMVDLVPDAQAISESFKGLRPDLNWFSANLRSTIAMGDPIVSGYSRRLKTGFNKVRNILLPIKDEAQSQLQAYKRGTGLNTRQTMATFYKDLYELQDINTVDDLGNIKSDTFYSLTAPINQKFYNDDLVLRNEITKAKKTGDLDILEKAQNEYTKWLNKHAERQYSEAWYDRFNLLTPTAADARQKALDEINNILRGPNRDALSDEDLERVSDLKYNLKRLGSLRNDNGELKTGEDLEIAKSIQAFNKKTAEMSFWETTEENRRWFNIILTKKQDQVKSGLITQDNYDRWFAANTQRNISPEFYKKRQVILDKIHTIMAKLPKDKFKDDMRVLWNSIFDVSKPYRDEDNVLVGNDFNPSESAVVRSDEEKIEEIKNKIIRFSGLTMEEEQELGGLWGALDTLTDTELARFSELRDRKDTHKSFLDKYVSKLELNTLMSAFAELGAISKWVPTTYYTSTYNQKLHEFRMAIDANFLLDMPRVEARFKAENEWYKTNHITKTKKTFNDGKTHFTEEDEPLYIWKDIIPTNEKLIEKNAPGFAFKTRFVKPEFINSNYESQNQEYFRTTNPNDYKLIPKRVINDEGQVKQSSYINENYERLKDYKDNNTKAKWDMLQFLSDTHLNGQQKLPSYKRLGFFLPGIVKNRYDRVGEQGVKGLKTEFLDHFRVTQEDKDLVLGDMSQVDLSIIPVKFSTKVKPDDQDLDLLGGILRHRMGVEEYAYLESELPTAKVIQSALKTAPKDVSQSQINTVIERLGFGKFIKASKDSKRYQVFDEFVRTMFYGETEHSHFGSAKTAKLVNNVFGLATLQVMTFNIPAHITNILSGEIQNIIEAAGGKYMNFKDYIKAKSIYAANIHNFWSDYTKEGNKSFWNALSEKLDVPQGAFENEFGEKTNYSRLRDVKNHIMIIKQGGEHELQISTMIAMALNYKVKLGDKMVSLNDALDFKHGHITIKPGAELTEQDIDIFKDRVHSVVRQLNGAYAKIDKSVAEKSFLGKLAFYMRKYFLPMIYRRFEPYKYDYEERDFKEGYYTTGIKILGDIAKFNINLVKNWDTYRKTLTPQQKLQLRRFASELLIIGILFTTIMAVGGYDDNRELEGRWLYTMGLYQLMKMKSETETFLPAPGFGLDELSSVFSSPFVPATTVKTIARTGKDLIAIGQDFLTGSDNSVFHRDYGIFSEGDLRLKADALKLSGFPLNMLTPENLIKNFELRQR